MKSSLPVYEYRRLLAKYKKLNNRLENHFITGRFIQFSKAEQSRLMGRIEKIKNQLQRFELILKSGASVLALSAVLYGGQAQAQFAAAGSEFSVNTYTTNNQRFSSIAMDSDGDFVIVWQSYDQDGSGGGIYAQRYNATGVAQGAEFRVNTNTISNQNYPSIAMDSDGDFVVVWHSNQDGSYDGIYAQRYNASGVAQGSEFRVNTYTTFSQNYPSIAMDSDGDFVVVWQSYQDGSGEGIYAQRYNASGIAQGSEFRVNTYTTSFQSKSSIAMDSDGDFVVAWHSLGQDGDSYGLYAQRYNASGLAQGSEFKVNTYTTSSQSNPKITMDSDGDFVVSWESSGQDGSNSGIYAQRYNALGVAQGVEFRVNTYTTNNQRISSIAIDSDGDFVVVWGSSGQDGSSYGVYAQRYNASGVAQGMEFRVNTYTTLNQYIPSIAMDNYGDFVVSWMSTGQDGDLYGIYVQRYVNNNSPLISAQTFSVAENSSNGTAVGTVVASDADGGQTLTYAITSGNTGSVFSINSSTGAISVNGSLDYETTTSYALTVEVSDNGTPIKSASATITINITNVSNEYTPSISAQTFSVAENSSNGTAVGTVVASDADGGQTLTYAITGGNTGSVFSINSNSGAITVAGSLDYETTTSYALTVQVSDNGTPVKSASATITINITNVSNEYTPSISAQTFSVAENSSNGTAVGTVVASDADGGQTLTYAITGGNTGSVFSINSSTGAITVNGSLDYETTTSYALTVEVSDNGTPVKSASATVTINITDVNEVTSVTASAQLAALTLYPNPAQSNVSVKIDGEVRVQVLDLSGTLIKETLLVNQSFSIADLNAGLYMIVLKKDGATTVKKLIVE